MSIRPNQNKPGWYIIDIGRGKHRRRCQFQGNIDDARELEKDLRSQGIPLQDIVTPKFSQCIPHFITSYKNNRPASTARTMISLEHLARHFGNLSLHSITNIGIEQYKAARLGQGIKPVTVQKELCALSTLLKWAKKQQMIANVPEINKFPGNMITSPLPAIPLQDDIEKIIGAVLIPWKQTAFKLMFFCGLRRREALRLRIQDIMLDRGLMIVRGKGNKQRIVPIIREDIKEGIKSSLKAAGKDQEHLWINPHTKQPYIDIMDALKAAAKRLGFKGRVYNHLLRHCFGTYGHEAGLSLRELQELMGHSTSQVTEIYTHLSSQHLTAALSRWQNPVVRRATTKPRKAKPAKAL
jgi:site-specific recombinase XerD